VKIINKMSKFFKINFSKLLNVGKLTNQGGLKRGITGNFKYLKTIKILLRSNVF